MITFLDAQKDKIIGYLDNDENKNYTDDLVEEGIDNTKILTFSMPSNIKEAVGIENRQRILVPHDKKGFQEFICYNAIQGKKRKKVKAVGSEIELNKLKIVYPKTHQELTMAQYVSLATDGLDWKPGNIKGGMFRTITFDTYLGGFDFLKRVANTFGLELIFRIEHDGRRVTGRYVDAVEKVGNRSGKEFVNAKDIVDIQKEVHTERYITALIVVRPDDEEGNPKDPLLVTDNDAFQRWNRNGQHLFGVHVINSENAEMSEEEALRYGRTELNKRIASVVDYYIEAVDISSVFPHEASYLGDYVGVIDDEFNPPLVAEARIINIKRPIRRPDMKKPVKKTYQIGEVVEHSQEDIEKRLADMRLNFERLIKIAEQKAQEAAELAGGITTSENFINALNRKADVDALGDFINRDEMTAMDEEVARRIQEAIRNIDLTDFATKEELAKAEEDIEKEIIQANAYNLIKNSAGYGNLLGWTTNGPDHEIVSISNRTLDNLGFGSGFRFVSGPTANGTKSMQQTLIVKAGEVHTFSWFIEKTVAGEFNMEIYENGELALSIPEYSDPTYSFQSGYLNYTPSTNRIVILFRAAESTEVTLTGLMFTEGTTPKRWTLAQGELYNAYVRTDEDGLVVIRVDENGEVEGYTRVSPEEFAIYYDEYGGSNPQRMFWFSKDKTVTRKLEALEEITMGTLKIVDIESATHRGWSIVSNADDRPE